MTRILLHGGYAGYWEGAGEDGVLFRKLVDAALASDKKILISFLAMDDLSEFPFMEEMKDSFKAISSEVEIVIATKDNFKSLIKEHKVWFLQGGNSKKHEEVLKDILKEDMLHDKVMLAGSSSGAGQLCVYAGTSQGDNVVKGKGILDFAFIPHANEKSVDDYIAKLRKVTDAPIVLLNENEMLEIEA